MVYYKAKIGNSLDEQHESIFKNIARQNGVYLTDYKISLYSMNEFEVDLHLQAAMHLLNSELRLRAYDTAQYARAERILFYPEKTFTRDQVLYTNEKNETLKVEELLKVAKYSIAFAEIMDPDDKDIELASAATTVFQGIQATLNNEDQQIPISTKLHLANGFLTTVIKANIKDSDTKRGITIASRLIDLVIDFFAGK